jgi:hypothetical protein
VTRARDILLAVLVVVVAVAARLGGPAAPESAPARSPTVDSGAYYALTAGTAKASDRTLLTEDRRTAELRFAGDVDPSWRQAVLTSIARARPEAARLIGLVDGLVEINVAGTGPRALGVTYDHGGSYGIVVDLPRVLATYGERGVDRVVLHELGHVVDAALVPEQLDAALDAQMPPGYACPPGERTSACAPRAERFAETFAKWATGDIGVNLNVGYAVAPPVVALDRWGEPLAALGEDSGQ